jgi:hypothetical protein
VDNFDKRQAVMAELLRDAGRSDRLIAEKLGGVVSSGLVGKVRRKLERVSFHAAKPRPRQASRRQVLLRADETSPLA